MFTVVRTISGWPWCKPRNFLSYLRLCAGGIFLVFLISSIGILSHRHFKILTCLDPSSRVSVSIWFTDKRTCFAYLCHICAACLNHVLVTGFINYHSNITRRKIMTAFFRPADKSQNLLSNRYSIKAGYFRDNSVNMSERSGIVTLLARS